MNSETEKIVTDLKRYFQQRTHPFVLLFGSIADGTQHPMSDVDLGIYLGSQSTLEDATYDAAILENRIGRRVDLAILDEIEKRDPRFAFSILERHLPIVVHDPEAYIGFKTRAQLYYLDALPLIEGNRDSLKRRIESGKIGERNYA